jgi:hypothetical protein
MLISLVSMASHHHLMRDSILSTVLAQASLASFPEMSSSQNITRYFSEPPRTIPHILQDKGFRFSEASRLILQLLSSCG